MPGNRNTKCHWRDTLTVELGRSEKQRRCQEPRHEPVDGGLQMPMLELDLELPRPQPVQEPVQVSGCGAE